MWLQKFSTQNFKNSLIKWKFQTNEWLSFLKIHSHPLDKSDIEICCASKELANGLAERRLASSESRVKTYGFPPSATVFRFLHPCQAANFNKPRQFENRFAIRARTHWLSLNTCALECTLIDTSDGSRKRKKKILKEEKKRHEDRRAERK